MQLSNLAGRRVSLAYRCRRSPAQTLPPQFSRRNSVLQLSRSLPTPASEVISDEDDSKLKELQELFKSADLDG